MAGEVHVIVYLLPLLFLLSFQYATKLEKGDYVIRYQFRHIDKERLEALKDLVCVVQYKLSTPISLDFYSTHAGAMEKRSGKKINGIVAAPHTVIPLYIAGVPDDKLVVAVWIVEFEL